MSLEHPPRLKNWKLFLDRLSIVVTSQCHIGITASTSHTNLVGNDQISCAWTRLPGDPKWVWEPKKRSVTLWNHAYHTLIHVPGFWNDWRGLIWPSGHHKSTFLVSTSCLVYVWNALMRHKGHHNSWWEAPFKELKIVPRPAKYSCHFQMSYWHHCIDFTHQIRWEWPNFMCMGALARGSKMSLGAANAAWRSETMPSIP